MTNDNVEESLPTPENSPEPVTEPIAEVAPKAIAEPAPPAGLEAVAAPEPTVEPEPVAESINTPESEPVPVPEPVAAPKPPVAAKPVPAPVPEPVPEEPGEDFGELLKQFEKSHSHKGEPGQKQLQGTVVSLSADQVFLDIGYKTEGVLPRSAFDDNAEGVKVGDSFPVSVTGRNEERYYELSRFKVAQPRDWSALEAAFAEKTAVVGTVTEVVKGGLRVDIGVRAFMPASRSGAKDAAELEKMVGTEINCRITKLDVLDEDVVVDRRVVLEEQARGLVEGRRAAMKEGDVVTGTVRSLAPYGAFIDLGGIDGLLHISDMAHTRVAKAEDVVAVGQEVQVRILKIDPETKKLSLGLKQLQPEPWATVPERFQAGQRVSGTVTRLQDFGAFVEIEPGIEGLIHISEMSWGKKVRHPSDVVKQGDRVDAVILAIKPEERRISLGLKHTLTDPWTEVRLKFPEGSQIEGPVTKLMNFGAFVQLTEGVEGLVHVSEIVADRRINHPGDLLRAGQVVKALVLAIDTEKRQIKLSMKQLIPTSIDEYIAEHKAGDVVSGRVMELGAGTAVVELGEGIRAQCRVKAAVSATPAAEPKADAKADLSSLTSLLSARWKGNAPAAAAKPEPIAESQIRSFRIVKLNADAKKIEVELA
ncbi:MAG TPA: S1 RNA-binding domain-containing protein [Terracidiphilus sp.]|nr:S1 RNA-binding domain-containing protein [Terracidiphilus sp.]